jgi:tRNA threonylcarbamoyladenosine biosynthesis protein TsaB
MTNLLAIESSASLCSVAVSYKGVLVTREQEGQRSHTQYMMAFIDEVFNELNCTIQDMDAVVFSAGPGSFTGVRLAASVAKALAYAASIPVIAISSLAVIAQTCSRITQSSTPCLVITDARMDELYVAEYNFDSNDCAYAVQGDMLLSINMFKLNQYQAKRIVGDAEILLQDIKSTSEYTWLSLTANAQDLIILGAKAYSEGFVTTALKAEAIYLRDKTSWKNTEQQLEAKEQLPKKNNK